MAARARVICASADLTEGGAGVRFEVGEGAAHTPAFAIRWNGEVRAYLNRCTHVAMELDWIPGRFLDVERKVLLCSTHGAEYDPASGACLGGPCRGGLAALPVVERDGLVIVDDDAEPQR
jgi:nitrite reductase/ring-hydroxylating ferredoxin subunit